MPRETTLLDRLRDWHDRVLANDGFRRWAAAFPLTRPLARRRARALFDLCAGFVYSQILQACVRLRLFDLLADGPLPLDRIARHCALTEEAAGTLLRAAVPLRLIAPRGVDGRGQPRFGLGTLGTTLVGNAGLTGMVEHHAMLYRDLDDPVALLRGEKRDTELGGYWPYAGDGDPAALTPEQVAAYSALMAASQPLVAAEVIAAYPFHRHRRVLDVGGGEGRFLTEVARAAPSLDLHLFDLPAVAARAEARFAAAGLAHRATCTGGDFLADPLPAGADLVTLVRVVHDHDDARVLALLRRVRAALPADGTLLIAEPMSAAPGAETVGDAYFGLYLLAMGRGRPRTAGGIAALLRRAGFDCIRDISTATPLLTALMTARPAAGWLETLDSRESGTGNPLQE